MADEWRPEQFRDEFKEKLEALVEQKRKAGAVKEVIELLADEITAATSDVIDLTELLRQSLKSKTGPAAPSTASRRAANDEGAGRRAAAASNRTVKASASVKPKRRKSA